MHSKVMSPSKAEIHYHDALKVMSPSKAEIHYHDALKVMPHSKAEIRYSMMHTKAEILYQWRTEGNVILKGRDPL